MVGELTEIKTLLSEHTRAIEILLAEREEHRAWVRDLRTAFIQHGVQGILAGSVIVLWYSVTQYFKH